MSKKIEFQYINYLDTGILYKLHGNVIAIHIHAHVHPEDSYKVKTPHQRKKDTKDVSLPQLMASSKNLVRFETNRKSSNSSKIPKVFQQCSSQTPLKQKHEIQGQPEYSPKSAKM